MELKRNEFDDFVEFRSFIDEIDAYDIIDIEIMTKDYDENKELKNFIRNYDKINAPMT